MDSSFQQQLINKYNRILQEPVENFSDLQIYFINVPENLKLIQSNGMLNGVIRKLSKAQDNQEIAQFFQEKMDIFQSELDKLKNDEDQSLNLQNKSEDQIQDQQNQFSQEIQNDFDHSIVLDKSEQSYMDFAEDESDLNKKDPLDRLYDYLLRHIINNQQFTNFIERYLKRQNDLGFNNITDLYNHIRSSYIISTDIQQKIKLAQLIYIFMKNDQLNIMMIQFFTDFLLKEPFYDQQLGYYQLYGLLNLERVNSNSENLIKLQKLIKSLNNADALILFLKDAYDLPIFKKKRQIVLDQLIKNQRSQNQQFNKKQLSLLIQCKDLKYDYPVSINFGLSKQLYILQRLSYQYSKEEQLAIIIYLVDNDFIQDTSLVNQLLYPYIKQDQQFLSLLTQLNKIIEDRQSTFQKDSTGIQLFRNQFPQLDIKEKVLSIYQQLDQDLTNYQE
ncbi:hypothetical protein pb186bvf_007546 [Paramecium bursaria]